MAEPLLSLAGLHAAQLPSLDATPDILAPFLISILQEAVPFADSIAPKNPAPVPAPAPPPWTPKGARSYPTACEARVDLLERAVPVLSGPQRDRRETWACRRSVHRDAAEAGTASWGEFCACFKERHAATEDAFTPTVISAREAVRWECGAVEAHEAGETYGNFTLGIAAMRHRVGRPLLKDRIFPVLQMTCAVMDAEAVADAAAVSRTEKPEFLVVSITVDDFFSSFPDAAPDGEDNNTVVAAYVSVERIRRLPDPGANDIEWIMATASDAKGGIPMWMQTLAVPGQIAKDVPNFLAWIAKERAPTAS
ncbi:hypothetical protein B0H67DRAFT_639138 [Lasiosphaeris hirsuta]|uniref:DUF3074 domain-containing protein n=1 Tax=Lasiosphaeris hirsuta TaxID=260670 RepID=A0AA40BAG1_9PEZI|nr:hypothetical protein B0H67DRAFT_639138 [Lasiosphaeris hirsuta]